MVEPIHSPFSQGLGRKISSLPSSLIRDQDVYKRGLIRLGESGNSIIDTLTGESYETLDEAYSAISQRGMSEIQTFSGLPGFSSTDPSGYPVLSDFVTNVNELLRSSDQSSLDIIGKSSVLESLKGKNIQLVRIGFSNTGGDTVNSIKELLADKTSYPQGEKIVQENFERMLSSTGVAGESIEPVPGYLISKEGLSNYLLRLRYLDDKGKYKYLTGDETVNVLTTLNAQFLDVDKVLNSIPDLDDLSAPSDKASSRLSSVTGKISKRESQSVSRRNLTMGQVEVEDILKLLKKPKVMDDAFRAAAPTTLQEAYLFMDSSLETTLKALNLDTTYSNRLLGKKGLTPLQQTQINRERKATQYVMQGETVEAAQQFFRDALRVQGLSSAEEFDEFTNIMKSQINEMMNADPGNKISTKSLMSNIQGKISSLEESKAGKDVISKYQRYLNILGEMPKAEDGSGFITDLAQKVHAKTLRGKIISAQKLLPTLAPDSQDAVNISANISQFTSELRNAITNADEYLRDRKKAPKVRKLENNTARLFFPKGQLKSVLDVITSSEDPGDFAAGLTKFGYIGAGSTELLKSEGGLGSVLGKRKSNYDRCKHWVSKRHNLWRNTSCHIP